MSNDQIPQEIMDEIFRASEPFTQDEQASLERLLQIAKSDTGQSKKVANFLPTNCGIFWLIFGCKIFVLLSSMTGSNLQHPSLLQL